MLDALDVGDENRIDVLREENENQFVIRWNRGERERTNT